ncbi:MAG: alpha/beta hydrolase [Steroidobacteraceae bacterium]
MVKWSQARSLFGFLLFILVTAPVVTAYGAQPQWATVNHVSLRYEVQGDGADVIVLLQESGLPLEMWDDVVPQLLTHRRSILRYDPRGIGLSEKIRVPFTLQDEVEDLHALLQVAQIRRPVVLIGGAKGGSVALAFAAAHPESVRGVIVTSPSALLQARAPRTWIDPARDPLGARRSEEATLKVIYPERFRADVGRWQRFLGMFGANDPDSQRLSEQLINTTGFADILPAIQCPTLLLATSLFVRPVESVRELASKIPQGRVVVVETGHLASWQSPELVIPIYRRFLREVGS